MTNTSKTEIKVVKEKVNHIKDMLDTIGFYSEEDYKNEIDELVASVKAAVDDCTDDDIPRLEELKYTISSCFDHTITNNQLKNLKLVLYMLERACKLLDGILYYVNYKNK